MVDEPDGPPEQDSRLVRGLFLRGPIPLAWLTACYDMSGKTVMVALAIWWQAGLKKRTTDLKLTTVSLARFGVDTKAKDRALKTLEEAGLVAVRRRAGKNPVVSLVLGQIDPPQMS